MTLWDIIDANMNEPMSSIFKALFKITNFFVHNWFWIKWICIIVILVIIAKLIRKHNKKVDEQKKNDQ